jgi:arsenite methyltransferase
VICDVFQGSKLAKHFDCQVARYCLTGHEVKFLSEEFALTLCYHGGFDASKTQIVDLPQKWVFDSDEDLGKFIYKLHAMTLIPGNEDQKIAQTIDGCKKILGVDHRNGKVYLNWPMKAIVAEK